MITFNEIARKYIRVFGRKLKVRDNNEQVECNVCTETPGKVWNETGWNDDGDSQEGRWEDCKACEGTGFVDTATITITHL